MSKPFFGRLARRPVREGVDEHENRLTEVLAAVIGSEACSGLALSLVRAWLQAAEEQLPEEPVFRRLRERVSDETFIVLVRTEVPIVVATRERRVDLELKLIPEDGPPLRLWVEVKHGTAPHSRQLWSYRDALKARDGDGVVLLVAPRMDLARFDQDQIPPDVPRLTWQDTAQVLEHYTRSSPIERFLVDELCNYLREEGLMDPERVSPEHLIAGACQAR